MKEKKRNFQREYKYKFNFSILLGVVSYTFPPNTWDTEKGRAGIQVLVLEKSPEQSELHEALLQETQTIQTSASINKVLKDCSHDHLFM